MAHLHRFCAYLCRVFTIQGSTMLTLTRFPLSFLSLSALTVALTLFSGTATTE